MEIELDVRPILEFINLPFDVMILRMLLTFGWIPIALAFLWGMKEIWMNYIQDKWGEKQKFLLLAIDIPKGNEQSLKAVENIFTYFGGAHGTLNLIEEYWEGRFQLSFSFEIVSIGGYTQFLIRCPKHWRNLTESAIYSQYPDAEITEVNDYTEDIPTKFPDDEYDIWGAEFIHTKNHMLPIKTYPEFEHQFGAPETHFRDPMASLMDLCGSLVDGEQLWFQMIVMPIGFDWMGEGDEMIGKILGEKQKRNDLTGKFLEFLNKTVTDLTKFIHGFESGESSRDETDDALKMMNLKPKSKKQIEAIHAKIGKLGFEAKIRFIYVAKKDVMNKPKVVNGFVGYMKQFMDLDTNNLRPDMDKTATSTSYFFKEKRLNYRKRCIMAGYKGRSGTVGRKKGVFNIEELATLWHFPIEAAVRAPLVQTTAGKKGEPPTYLPSREGEDVDYSGDNIFADEKNDESFASEDEGMSEQDIFSEGDESDEDMIVPVNLPKVEDIEGDEDIEKDEIFEEIDKEIKVEDEVRNEKSEKEVVLQEVEKENKFDLRKEERVNQREQVKKVEDGDNKKEQLGGEDVRGGKLNKKKNDLKDEIFKEVDTELIQRKMKVRKKKFNKKDEKMVSREINGGKTEFREKGNEERAMRKKIQSGSNRNNLKVEMREVRNTKVNANVNVLRTGVQKGGGSGRPPGNLPIG